MQERRKYVRSNGLVLVNYKIPELKVEGKSTAYDISEGGLRINTDKKVKTGTLLEMEIYLPGASQPIFAKSTAVWSHKCKHQGGSNSAGPKCLYTGVKFIAINKNKKTKVATYIQRKLQQLKHIQSE